MQILREWIPFRGYDHDQSREWNERDFWLRSWLHMLLGLPLAGGIAFLLTAWAPVSETPQEPMPILFMLIAIIAIAAISFHITRRPSYRIYQKIMKNKAYYFS